MKNKLASIFFISIIFFLWIQGCASLNVRQPFVERSYYMLDAGVPEKTLDASEKDSISVLLTPFRISSAFDETSFIYKTGENQFVNDFYHVFFELPNELVRQELKNWMNELSVFQVFDAGSSVKTDWMLEGEILKLYGDFANDPVAVFSIRILLLKQTQYDYDLAFQKVYTQTIRIQNKTPETLIKGWNEALRLMFNEISEDIYKEIKGQL